MLPHLHVESMMYENGTDSINMLTAPTSAPQRHETALNNILKHTALSSLCFASQKRGHCAGDGVAGHTLAFSLVHEQLRGLIGSSLLPARDEETMYHDLTRYMSPIPREKEVWCMRRRWLIDCGKVVRTVAWREI